MENPNDVKYVDLSNDKLVDDTDTQEKHEMLLELIKIADMAQTIESLIKHDMIIPNEDSKEDIKIILHKLRIFAVEKSALPT